MSPLVSSPDEYGCGVASIPACDPDLPERHPALQGFQTLGELFQLKGKALFLWYIKAGN